MAKPKTPGQIALKKMRTSTLVNELIARILRTKPNLQPQHALHLASLLILDTKTPKK